MLGGRPGQSSRAVGELYEDIGTVLFRFPKSVVHPIVRQVFHCISSILLMGRNLGTINIKGKSLRLKEKRRAGLLDKFAAWTAETTASGSNRR